MSVEGPKLILIMRSLFYTRRALNVASTTESSGLSFLKLVFFPTSIVPCETRRRTSVSA